VPAASGKPPIPFVLGRLGGASLAVLLAAGSTPAELDQVELDVPSGVVAERLPFDVPFVVKGVAPPGTRRVEATYSQRIGRDGPYGSEEPSSPLVSGVDAEGRFRLQMPTLPPNRHLRFRLTFERRLASGDAFRAAVLEILERELGPGITDVGAERAAALHAAILNRFDLALNGDRAGSWGRGDLVRQAPRPLFDGAAAPDRVQRALGELARDVLAAQVERGDALERQGEVAGSLERELREVSESPDLQGLLYALERRPETDPRNPANRVTLSRPARRLVGLEAAARAAVAAGRGPAEAEVDLDDAARPDDADAFAERYRLTAAALQELREWLQSLVLATGENRRVTDELVRTGALSPSAVDSLQAISGMGQGGLRRAERWAEALAAGARDVARTLRAREQALAAMAAAIEGEALNAVVRQTVVSEPATSEAGIYVGLDLGVLYPPEMDRASLYLGANLYFRPINKRASLRTHGSLGHRFSLTFGISLNNLKLEEGDPRFESLLGDDSNLLVGAGLRLSRSLRLSAGALLFLKNDPNPLVTDRSLAATFYTALSFDVDLVRALRSLGQ
jgi:hypothetical protein